MSQPAMFDYSKVIQPFPQGAASPVMFLGFENPMNEFDNSPEKNIVESELLFTNSLHYHSNQLQSATIIP